MKRISRFGCEQVQSSILMVGVEQSWPCSNCGHVTASHFEWSDTTYLGDAHVHMYVQDKDMGGCTECDDCPRWWINH